MKRIFLVVLDSVGIGEMPDAARYGDEGSNTLRSASKSPDYDLHNMIAQGLYNIAGVDWADGVEAPAGAYGKMKECSAGKDTTSGHWEIAGLISRNAMPTFPDGFPAELISQLEEASGRGILCNKPYSGTEVIKDYGEEHMATGKLIDYTSADSVLQIAAHEEVVPLEELYSICRETRKICSGEWAVGRVIARPFVGSSPADFTRTSNRHDFSVEPFDQTMLDVL